MKKKKRKLRPVFLVLLLLLLAAGAGVFFLGGKAEESITLNTDIQRSSLLLQSSKTQFKVSESAEAVLTVTANEVMEGTVYIQDELGENLLTLELKNGTATGSIGILEEEPRCMELTAVMGEAKSQTLSLYVAPEVTIDMIATGYMVAEELGQALAQQGFTEIDETAIAAAREWLMADERVEATVLMDNGVFYYTTDGIAGACMPGPKEGTFGSSNFTQEPNDTLSTYQAWSDGGLDEFQYLWSDNTLTNDRILVLCPQYRADITTWSSDPCWHNDTYADMATEVAEALGCAVPEIYNDQDAVSMLVSGKMNEYGIILFNTHGCMIGPKDTAEEEKLFVMQMQKGSTLHALDEQYDTYAAYLKDYLAVSEDDYDRFFTKYTTDAEKNLKTCQMYIQVADSKESFAEEKANQEAGIDEPVQTCVGLFITANMLTSLYQDTMFDNSIVYLGLCYSVQNPQLVQFLVDHGAAACVGYTNEVDSRVEKTNCKTFFRDLICMVKKESRFKTVEESCKSFHMGLYVTRVYTILQRITANPLAKIFKKDEYETNQYNMCVLADPTDYTLYGTGNIEAEVRQEDTNEPLGAATVELYRWLDQEFVLMGTTVTDGSGIFRIKKLPWGVYVAKITTQEGISAVASCILAGKNLSDGVILVRGDSPYYTYIIEKLEPEIGLFELGEKAGTAYSFEDYGWDERTGILSAAIQDMNGDSVDDMVLLRVEMDKESGIKRQQLYADMYMLEERKVVLKDSILLDDFNNCENHNTWLAIYPMDQDGDEENDRCDLFIQSYAKGCLVDYSQPMYARFYFDGEALRKVFHVEQSSGGTTEAAFSNYSYDEATGEEVVSDLKGFMDLPKIMRQFLGKNMPVNIQDNINDYPSYIGSTKLQAVAELNSSGSYTGGEFLMNVMDHTALREELENLKNILKGTK